MGMPGKDAVRFAAWTILVIWWIARLLGDDVARVEMLFVLGSVAWPIVRGWRGALGTQLRPVLAWAAGAVALRMAGEAGVLAGHVRGGALLSYFSDLAILAALITVFNARRPGAGAWALLMGMLVVVFLVPLLEGSGLATGGATGRGWALEAPWSWFFLLLAGAGVTNYLPTRFWPAAVLVGAGLALEYSGLTGGPSGPSGMASWLLAAGMWAAEWRAGTKRGETELERLWFWFRDHWGAVWGLRVLERFNQATARAGWPLRLSWHGAESDGPWPRDEAKALLAGVLRRFADAERLEAEAGGGPCQKGEVGGS